jgi:hypothetical protein
MRLSQSQRPLPPIGSDSSAGACQGLLATIDEGPLLSAIAPATGRLNDLEDVLARPPPRGVGHGAGC